MAEVESELQSVCEIKSIIYMYYNMYVYHMFPITLEIFNNLLPLSF